MLKKYTVFFKKQFKYRWVRPAFFWDNYLYLSQWFLRSVQPYFYRGYIRYPMYLKLHFYRLLFRILKKKLKKKNIYFFVTCKVNRSLSRKQKNARMGKGVGKRYKFVYYFEPYYPLFIVYNSHLVRLNWVKRFLWVHTKVRIFWIPTYVTLATKPIQKIVDMWEYYIIGRKKYSLQLHRQKWFYTLRYILLNYPNSYVNIYFTSIKHFHRVLLKSPFHYKLVKYNVQHPHLNLVMVIKFKSYKPYSFFQGYFKYLSKHFSSITIKYKYLKK